MPQFPVRLREWVEQQLKAAPLQDHPPGKICRFANGEICKRLPEPAKIADLFDGRERCEKLN